MPFVQSYRLWRFRTTAESPVLYGIMAFPAIELVTSVGGLESWEPPGEPLDRPGKNDYDKEEFESVRSTLW